MADSINIIQREERIPVKPAAASIIVVNVGPQGPPGPINPNVGTPVISGLSVRGSSSVIYASAGLAGSHIYLDPGANGQGLLLKIGTDVDLVYQANLWMTYQMRVNVTGMYYINCNFLQNGFSSGAPLGAQLGIRVNGTAIRRHSVNTAAWSSVNIACVSYLTAGDLVSLFGYTPSTDWSVSANQTQTPTDGYAPRLDVWRFLGAL